MKNLGLYRVKIWTILLLILGCSFINQSALAVDSFIRAEEKVCTADAETNRCSSLVQWQADTIAGQRSCVFIKETKSLWACSSNQKQDYPFIFRNQSTTLELRRGSSSYSNSELYDNSDLLGSVNLIALDSSANTNTTEYVDVKKDYYKKFNSSSNTSSWDGKLFFRTVGLASGKIALTVRSFRHKSLKTNEDDEINFRDEGIFSDDFLVDYDALNQTEINSLPSWKQELIEGREGGQLGAKVGFHLAIFPHSSIKHNPFKSNRAGNPEANGAYLSYRFYGVVAATAFGNDISEYYVNPNNLNAGKKHILGKFEGRVVVENPDSENSEVIGVDILSPATALKDVNGDYLYGYEPTISLDGNLLIYSGNPFPEVRLGNGGMVTYSYSRNHFVNETWSKPENIVDIYSTYGPGRPGGEFTISGIPFSQYFPIARYPIRDYQGAIVNAPIFGAYPWLSFDASEVFFASKQNFYGPSRQATTLVGARTHGTLVNVDGDMNLTRGNPTDRYSNWLSTDEGRILFSAYKALQYPNTSTDDGLIERGFEQVLLSPVGMFGTSWNPYALEQDKALPLSGSQHVYGFIASGGSKYAEIELPDFYDDLVLYYPMNEPLQIDYDYINQYVDNNYQPVESSEENRRRFKFYVENETADYSTYLHKGEFVGYSETPTQSAVSYPFEFNDTKNVWAATYQQLDIPDSNEVDRNEKLDALGINASSSLHDIQSGIYGNSIYFKQGGSIETTIKSEAYEKIDSKQEFTFSFWVNRGQPSAGNPSLNVTGQAFNLRGVFSLWLNNDDLAFRLYTSRFPFSSGGFTSENRVRVPLEDAWNHYGIVYKRSLLTLYINGEEVYSQNVRGSLGDISDYSDGVRLTLGPGNSLNGVSHTQMDETYIYSTALDESEIKKLAGLKKQVATNSSINVPEHFVNLPQESASSVDENNSTMIQALGKDLFFSTDLSLDNTISCASCHIPQNAFSDTRALSDGISGQTTNRNTQPLQNLLFGEKFTFNGGADSLEEQILHPIIAENEMGFNANPNALLDRLNSNSYWGNQFNITFGEDVSFTNLSISLARYIRGLITEDEVLSDNLLIQQGREIFNSTANCVACHSGLSLSDGKFHNIGLNDEELDTGRAEVSQRETDVGAFKTPSLINLSITAPYFHDGSALTLRDVVNHYNRGGNQTQNQSSFVKPLRLSAFQINALVAYLSSLERNVAEK